jgi:glycerophosphoryl diester phosphodiesterase
VITLERLDGRPLRIGHRGAAALAPENTLRSFRAAVEAGVDLIEFDVLELASGELVLAHSDDLREVSHGLATGTVRRLALADLRTVAPELPTLDEALEFFVVEAPGIGVHLDLKTGGAAEKVVAVLDRFGLVERALVSSFHVSALRRMSRLEPRVRTGVSFPQDRLRISRRRGSAPVIRTVLRGLRPTTPLVADLLLARSRASALVLHHTLVGERTVRRAHARGVPVVAWTVEDERDLVRLDRAGVDAIVVNNPAIFLSSTLQP